MMSSDPSPSFAVIALIKLGMWNREEQCLVLATRLGSHLIAHLGPHQFLGRTIVQITIRLLQNHLVVRLPLVHKQGAQFLVACLPVCLVPQLPHQFLVPHQLLLLGAQCLLLVPHQDQPLELHLLLLVARTLIGPNIVPSMALTWSLILMLVM